MLPLLALVLAAPLNPVRNAVQPIGRELALDPFIEKLVEPNAKDSELIKLQKDRARERALYIEKNRLVMNVTGTWSAIYFGAYMQELRSLWENLAELTTDPDQKLKCAEGRVEFAKEFEEYIKVRVRAGADPTQNLNAAKAARIDAEVDLLKLKQSLKEKK
jgi:hypothetical protein